MFYSPERGFLSPSIHEDIPDNAVEISHEDYIALLVAQENGQQIKPTYDGRPEAVDILTPLTQFASSIRTERDRRLMNSDRYVLPDYPHKDEANRKAWIEYRQVLRDLPQMVGFPWGGINDPAVPWPTPPD